MATFELISQDPDESYDDRPASLLSLSDWLAAKRAGTATWDVETYEGVGLSFSDGAHEWLLPSFGDARSLGRNCEVAADRLAAGKIAVFRTAILDAGSYLLLVPDGDRVRVVKSREKPPGDGVFPYRPSLRNDPDEAVDAVYAWAEANAERLLAPSGNAALDRAEGKHLRLGRTELVEALRTAAGPAPEVADLVGARTFGPAEPRG